MSAVKGSATEFHCVFVGILKAEMLAHYGSKPRLWAGCFSIGNEPLDSILPGVYRVNCEPVVFTIKVLSSGTLALAGGDVEHGSGRHLEAPLRRVGDGKRLFRYVYKITKR